MLNTILKLINIFFLHIILNDTQFQSTSLTVATLIHGNLT
jgi:hypothetical protein